MVGLTRRNWHSRKDSHPHLRRSKRRALVIELREHSKCRIKNAKCGSKRLKRRNAEGKGRLGPCRPPRLSTIFQSAIPFSKSIYLGRHSALKMVGCHGACNACNPIATRRRSRTAAARPVRSWPSPVFASRKSEIVLVLLLHPENRGRERERGGLFILRFAFCIKKSSIRVSRPVFRFGRPARISQHLCSCRS